MFFCNGCGKEFKVNENPAVFDREGWAYHYKCLKAKESRNKVPADLPESGASAERISSVICFKRAKHYKFIRWRK